MTKLFKTHKDWLLSGTVMIRTSGEMQTRQLLANAFDLRTHCNNDDARWDKVFWSLDFNCLDAITDAAATVPRCVGIAANKLGIPVAHFTSFAQFLRAKIPEKPTVISLTYCDSAVQMTVDCGDKSVTIHDRMRGDTVRLAFEQFDEATAQVKSLREKLGVDI